VGTPGRLNDLLALANPPVTNLNACGYVVLDEADRMLDMGFAPQIDKIFQLLPSKRQTLFFTGTWPTPCEVHARVLTTAPSASSQRRGRARCSSLPSRT